MSRGATPSLSQASDDGIPHESPTPWRTAASRRTSRSSTGRFATARGPAASGGGQRPPAEPSPSTPRPRRSARVAPSGASGVSRIRDALPTAGFRGKPCRIGSFRARPRLCAPVGSRVRKTRWNRPPARIGVLARSPRLRHRRHRPGRRLARPAAPRRRGRRRLPRARLGPPERARPFAARSTGHASSAATSATRPCSSGARRVRDRRPSSTSPPRPSSASPTATRSPPSRRTSRAPGRCSKPAAGARVKQVVLASSDKAYGDQPRSSPTTRTRRSRGATRTTSASRAQT